MRIALLALALTVTVLVAPRAQSTGHRATVPQSTLIAPSGAIRDNFGRSVAVSGDYMIVGANGVDRGGVPDIGEAYIYRREGAGWVLEATLQPELSTGPVFFGWSVAINGATAVVGALGDNTGGQVNRGAAYVFTRTGPTWVQQAKLLMPDGGAGDEAGVSVAIATVGAVETIVVGAPYHGDDDAGAAWLFERNAGVWTFVTKLVRFGDASEPNFGRSVALNGRNGLILVGSAPEQVFTPQAAGDGIAHLFVKVAGGWAPSTLIRSPNRSRCPNAHFGAAIATDDSANPLLGASARFVIGAPRDCGGTDLTPAGAAHVVDVYGAGPAPIRFFSPVSELRPQAPQASQRFGSSVAIDGHVLVGAPGAPPGSTTPGGFVTFFSLPAPANATGPLPWPGIDLFAPDALTAEHFGASVALSALVGAVGMPDDAVGGRPEQGSVRVLDLARLDSDEDGLFDAWERQYGLDHLSAAGDNGAAGDPDHDGRSNLEEQQATTHPRNVAALTRYLAEGASTDFFDTRIALVNPGAANAKVLLRFLKNDGTVVGHLLDVPALRRASVLVDNLPSMNGAEFSTTIETDAQVVVDRTMWWDSATAYGTHAETAVDAPATTWYLAEGATHSGFNLFYLLQNPTATAAAVQVSYLLPAGAPIVKTYAVPPNSRFNIWVNRESAALASTDVSGVIVSTNDVPLIVERAMYLDAGGLAFGAGHESAGVRAPATQWFLAEGATGTYFDLFVLIANPGTTDAQVEARYLLPNGTTITKPHTVAARSRFNIWVDRQDPLLADTAVSTVVSSTKGVPIIVERAMWWPGPQAATWHEAHNSAGATVTGTRWAVADGETGGSANVSTYVLIANPSATAATVRVTLLFDSIIPLSREFPIAANSRFNVDMGREFPFGGVSRSYGVLVESIGSTPVPIVVERAMYSDARGVTWAAGTNVLATRLP